MSIIDDVMTDKITLHGLGFVQVQLEGSQRLHVWHPELPRRACFESSAIHDHRFDFISRVLVGTQCNIEYRVDPSFEGAAQEEIGCYNGGTALVDAKGVLPDRDSIDDDDELQQYFRRKGKAKPVEALWCKENGYSWTYKTDIPHATFEVLEDGDKYCRGIVFSLADLA